MFLCIVAVTTVTSVWRTKPFQDIYCKHGCFQLWWVNVQPNWCSGTTSETA